MRRFQLIIRLFVIAAAVLVVGNSATWAQDQAPDSKEKFIAAWEDAIKALPSTVIFEKTTENGVYNFETTAFPYKGKLKLLNAYIDKDLDYYYDYDLNVGNILKGVAEIALDAPPEELLKKYPQSYSTWQRNHYLFFEPEAKAWLNATGWYAHEAAKMENTPSSTEKSSCAVQNVWKMVGNIFVPVSVFILVFLFLSIPVKKSHKKQQAKFDLSIDRQLKTLEIAEESLALQKKQTELLQKILEGKERS